VLRLRARLRQKRLIFGAMRRFLSFWWTCAKRAFWGNTAFANDWQWVFGVPICSAVAAGLNNKLHLSELTTDSAIADVFLAALAAFIVTWLVAFLVRLLNAPVLLYDEQRRIAERALASNAAGEPSIFRLSVGESGPYFQTTGSNLYSTQRTFKLKVENIHGNRHLAHCKVSVLKVEPPIEYGDGPWMVASDFEVASGDTAFVPLVQYGEAHDSFFELLPATLASPKFDIGKEYVLTLRATSPRSAFQDFQCKVWVEDGRLRIENVTPPALTPREAINELGRLRSKETELRNEWVKSDAQFADWKERITKLRDDVERNVAVCSAADAHRFKTVGNLRHTVPAGLEVFNPEHDMLVRISTRDLDWLDDFIRSRAA
jgi:hypothetical protein